MDSQLFYQTKNDPGITKISYEKKNRPLVSDYVSNQPVVPSEVIPGETALFYSDSYGCLLKGKVTSFNEQDNSYLIDGMKRKGTKVRYSKGHGKT